MIPGNLGGKFEIFDVKGDFIGSSVLATFVFQFFLCPDSTLSLLTSKISNFPPKFPGIMVIWDT